MKKLVNKKWFCLLFCFVVSSLIILFTSKCSPLYPFNDWVDANAFFTTGKGIFNGIVPYRDLFEQKGLLLYFIYGIGYLISHTSFIGIYFFEVIFWTFTLYYCFKIVEMFIPRKYGFIIIPIFMAFLTTSRAFTHGGSAEEFCYLGLAMSLYYFLKHFKEKELTNKEFIINGFIAGCILSIKYTILGFWFAFMMCLFIEYMFRKEYKKGFMACIYFLIGMAIPVVISCIYLILNNALKDYINVYFIINMTVYPPNSNGIFYRLISVARIFYNVCKANGVLIGWAGLLFPLFILTTKIKNREKIYLIIIFAFTIFGIYFGLKSYPYYAFPIFIFSIFSLIVLFSYLDQIIKSEKRLLSLTVVALISSLFVAYNCANYKKFRSVKKEDLFQYKFAQIINKEKNPTFVNMGFLDAGIYTLGDIMPTTYYFQRNNFEYDRYPYLEDAFKEYIDTKKTMFILYYTKLPLKEVFAKEENLDANYELVAQEKYNFERKKLNAFLFKVRN